MNPLKEAGLQETRRQFFGRTARNVGSLALMSMLGESAAQAAGPRGAGVGRSDMPHHRPRAKRVIYMHLVGAPPQLDLFDYKPQLQDWFDKDLPESIRNGQRLTTMTSGQSRFPIAPTAFKFNQHGKSGMWLSELLPNTGKMADDLCLIRTMHTEAINHEPAITFIQSGNQIPGKPCLGAWLAYGLGSMNQDLPTFVVLNATHSHPRANVQAISARLWSSGFLSAEYAGVALRSSGDPVLYINNPDGVDRSTRRQMLDGINSLNELNHRRLLDPETRTRISQYEMAFRMQASVPDLTDLSKEPESTYKLYGEEARKGGSFTHSCLLARRLVERGVRFVQIYQRGWDVHGGLVDVLPTQCRDIDQACWALVQDLKARGMLDDTLIILGGEFGRTVYCQGALSRKEYGRDHHPRCYSLWMAGGGIKGGTVWGETDDFSYNIVKDPVHIRDWHATVMHLMGIDHERFTYPYQGLDQRLTGVEKAAPIQGILA